MVKAFGPHRAGLDNVTSRRDLRPWPEANRRPDSQVLEAQKQQGAPGLAPWDVRATGPGRLQCREGRMSWQDRAACRGMDAPLFFGPDNEPRPEREIREAKAKAVCQLCPVRVQCLDYALRNSIRHGIWGGLDGEERACERRRRARRPDAA